MSFETFFDAYIECALWSSTDNSDDSGGEPLDANYGVESFTKKTLASLRREAKEFYQSYSWMWAGVIDDAQAGHDFWLTRNGHGAGFWDRGLGALGDKLTDLCRPYGNVDIYVNRKRLHVF